MAKGETTMKTLKLIILILFITLFTENSFPQSEWVLKSTGCNLYSVHFVDEMSGFAVGDSGTILATIDGGANWLCTESGTTKSLKCVFFINSLTGWTSGDEGTILKTTNGGVNWISVTSGTTSGFSAVYFANADTGFAIGPSVVRKSVNGGVSWVASGPVTGSALYFSSGLVGIAANQSVALSRTTNGGTAWFSNVIEYPSGRYSMSFINANTGWLCGTGNKVHMTTNGGVNWTNYTTPASAASTFYGTDFPDYSNGYIVGTSGNIYRSTNSGVNWTSQTGGTTKTLRSVYFIDEYTGFIVGDEGTILKTTNSGTNWTSQLIQYTPPFLHTYHLNDVHFINEMIGFTTGLLGYINKTTDGGETWSTITSASFNWMYSIYFPTDNDTGWACGRLGTIQKTFNAGTNWVLQGSGTSEHLNSIVVDKFIGPASLIGWCVGNNGKILATSSGGISWSSQISGTTNNLNSVFVFDYYDAIVCGDAGTILKTTDAGLNWTTETSSTMSNLFSIHFIDNNTGYVCGSGGAILKSTDNGETWVSQSSGTSNKLNSIAFDEIMTENGFAVGEKGTIVATHDGGMSWNLQGAGGSTELNSVFVKNLPSDAGSSSVTLIRMVGKLAKYAKKIAATALPVELSAFYSNLQNNNVTLSWQTSSETNNFGFDIERSSLTDTWTKVGFVKGKGNSNISQNYSYSDQLTKSGKYKYRLKQTDYNGNFEYYYLRNEIEIGNPSELRLFQNYPNPFNPETIISFELPVPGKITLSIYDISGRLVSRLLDENISAGYYSKAFNASGLSSGVYFYKINLTSESGSFQSVRKMIIAK